jgi:hypothetical protein
LGESGAIQATTFLLLLALCLAGYLAYALFPAFNDNFSVKQAIQQIANDGWRLTGREDLRNRVIAKLPTIGSHAVADSTGHLVEVPGLLVSEPDVTVSCGDRGQDCSAAEGQVVISVEYRRVVPLPFLKEKTLTLHFHPSASAVLTPVVW